MDTRLFSFYRSRNLIHTGLRGALLLVLALGFGRPADALTATANASSQPASYPAEFISDTWAGTPITNSVNANPNVTAGYSVDPNSNVASGFVSSNSATLSDYWTGTSDIKIIDTLASFSGLTSTLSTGHLILHYAGSVAGGSAYEAAWQAQNGGPYNTAGVDVHFSLYNGYTNNNALDIYRSAACLPGNYTTCSLTNGSFTGTIDLPYYVSTDYPTLTITTELYGFAGYGGNVTFDPTIEIVLPQGVSLTGSYAYLIPASVPEPSAPAYFASGLVVVGILTRRRRLLSSDT